MPRGPHNAPPLGKTDAGRGTAMVAAAALAHFDKHQGSIPVAHDQVDFTATAPWGSIIARHQTQALGLQVCQCPRFRSITLLFGADPLWIEIAH
jgi:hypothetical protein